MNLSVGGLEGVWVRINGFIAIPKVVRVWHFTVHAKSSEAVYSMVALARPFLLYIQSEEEDRDLANPRLQNRGPISMSKSRSLHTNYIQNCQFTQYCM